MLRRLGIPAGARAIIWQFLCLGIGTFIFARMGWDFVYSLAYILSFLIPGFILARNDEGVDVLTGGAFFLVWLLTYPIVRCLVLLNGVSCLAHANAPVCRGIGSCFAQTVHFHYGEQIQRMDLAAFVSDMDNLIDLVLNLVPYALDKGLIWLFGLNWMVVVANLLVVFACHAFAGRLAMEAMSSH
jgi:hypothetical protein